MSSDATPELEPIAFGQRLQILRTRRGMSRPTLAGLLGKSPSWLKAVETGRLQAPRLPMLLRIAETLRVRDLAELTGDSSVDGSSVLFIGPGHKRLAAVRSAIDTYPLVSDREAPSLPHLRARLARAWSARHGSPNHRDVIGALLPDLVQDAQLAVRQVDRAADRRAAQALLSEVYGLAQFFLAYQPDSALLWRVAERGMVAAQESEDPHAIGVAAWLAIEAHRDSAHYDAADHITEEARRFLVPYLSDGCEDVRAIAGALEIAAGYTAARRGQAGPAWGWWDRAQVAARALPPGYYHPITSFSQAIMGAHAVTLAVELHAGGESVRQAARADAATIPSRPRRARHRIEEARGYQLAGHVETALATLERAHETAPETIKYNGYARRIVLEETESRSPALRQRASRLAVNLGMLAA
ncbi:transcriptional regulator [Streptomyces alkaliterrae]|uniref:Helix-turn-helix domain-containing protein n=1 Tax=Streptomyces alkaliterrae TaxID=2213162 RepID=A0A5P0YXN2_9ACTN|nr:transcriptional regulator [Streptomyces alkaliterrae]MBB1254373.1 transcriptional regulator [Streptomyces alkaliterrae]MBB1258686.1 transcriptional regulator [Streptomyces alkaliterrae]MQS04750.1 helix-turn-helix domain-containing protein [Streptomyces alkaliterrae]